MSIAYCVDHDEHVDWDQDTETHRFCHAADGVRFTEPTSWAPEVQTAGNGDDWTGNSCLFATEEEALQWADDLMMRWTAVSNTRAVPSDDPVNYQVRRGVNGYLYFKHV